MLYMPQPLPYLLAFSAISRALPAPARCRRRAGRLHFPAAPHRTRGARTRAGRFTTPHLLRRFRAALPLLFPLLPSLWRPAVCCLGRWEERVRASPTVTWAVLEPTSLAGVVTHGASCSSTYHHCHRAAAAQPLLPFGCRCKLAAAARTLLRWRRFHHQRQHSAAGLRLLPWREGEGRRMEKRK